MHLLLDIRKDKVHHEPCQFTHVKNENLAYLSEATICSYSGRILVLSNGEYDLHPQKHPIVDKNLHLDDFQSFEYGILDLVGIGHGFLGNLSFFHFFFN